MYGLYTNVQSKKRIVTVVGGFLHLVLLLYVYSELNMEQCTLYKTFYITYLNMDIALHYIP